MKKRTETEKDLQKEMEVLRHRVSELEEHKIESEQAKKKARLQNEFLNDVIEALGHPFYVIDVNDYTIKLANSNTFSGDLSKKVTCYGLTHKQKSPCKGVEHPCPLEQVKKTRKPVRVEHVHYVNGDPRIVEIRAFPIFNSVGNLTQMIESSIDITNLKQVETKLQNSEERLRVLFEYAPDAYYINDLKGTFIDGNEAAEKVLGYKREELIGKSFLTLKLLAPGQIKKAAKLLVKNRLGKATGPDEFVVNRKDGSSVPVEIRTIPMKIEGKTLVLAIARDITDRKKAEETLLDAEKKYRTIFENAVEGIFQTTPDGCFISVNPSMARILGYSSPEELTENRMDIERQGYVLPGRRKEFLKQIEKQSEVQDFEYEAYCKDGKKVWLSENVCVVRDSEGEILYFEGTVEDITERKRTEEKLREYSMNLEQTVEERSKELRLALKETEFERDKVDGILKSLADGLIVTDNQKRIILMNREAENLLHVRLSDVINRSIISAIRDNTLRERIATILDRKEPRSEFDFEIPGENSMQSRVFRARTSAIQDKTGAITGIVIIMNDVTYEREVDLMKTEFITSAAHELRTPITSIRGFSEILLSKGDIKEEEKEKFLSYINQQSVNLTAILNDLFTISRIESGKRIILNRVICDFSMLVTDTVSNFQNLFPKHKFETIMPSTPAKLMLDEKRLKDALERILSNAVKFSSEGTSIWIKGELLNRDFQLSIEDQGIGMNPDQLEKVFDKYYRADATDTALEGAGLGLTIAKYFIEAHGGKVWVESELCKGTTVRFTFPLESEAGS